MAYPDNVLSWTDKQDGVDTIFADDINAIANDLIAAETEINTHKSDTLKHRQASGTTQSGTLANAEGSGTTASGDYSHAGGQGTIAAGAAQTAIGKYNVSDTDSLLIIGKGTSDGARANALALDSKGNLSMAGGMLETVNLIGTAYSAAQDIDVKTSGTVFLNTASATANITANFRGDASTTIDSLLAVGKAITFTVMITNGATPYYISAYKIDGTTVTPKWSGGTAPSSGNANSIDAYTFTIIKTAASTYTVLANRTKFA